MPRKTKTPEPQEEFDEEEYLPKKAKTEVDSKLLNAVLDVINFYQDPSGSTCGTIVKRLEYQGIIVESSDVRAVLKSAVHSGQLMQPNRARWKPIESRKNPILAPTQPSYKPDQDFQPIVGLSRDLVTEIMQYLTIKQIFAFRCVCKGWRNLIDSSKMWKTINFTVDQVPITVVNSLMKIASGIVETFIIDGDFVFVNNDDISLFSLIDSLLSSSASSLMHYESYNVFEAPNMDLLSKCCNLQHLTLLESKISLETVEKLVPQLPLLKEFSVFLGSSYDDINIQWGPRMELLHIETDGEDINLNVPENLSKFYVGKSPQHENNISQFVSISNFSALLTEKMKSLELYEFALLKNHLNLLNSLKVQVLGLYIHMYYVASDNSTLSLNFPELKSLTLTGGGTNLKFNCPLLQNLVFNKLETISSCEFSSLDFLETISISRSYWGVKVQFPSVLKDSISLREVTWIEPVEYSWPNIEFLSLKSDVPNSYINQLQSLRILRLSLKQDDLDIQLPVLQELRVKGCLKLILDTPCLKVLRVKTITHIHCKTLASLECIQQLKPKELACAKRDLSKADLDEIMACKSINKLSLLPCYNDATVQAIAKGMKEQLRAIHLVPYLTSSITDKGMYALCKFCPNIEELTLDNCRNVSGRTVRDLILSSKNIKRVSISHMPKISKATLLKGLAKTQFICIFNNIRVQ